MNKPLISTVINAETEDVTILGKTKKQMLAYESRKSRCPHMQAIERASCGRSILI